jgi:hypothetical protein
MLVARMLGKKLTGWWPQRRRSWPFYIGERRCQTQILCRISGGDRT